MLASSTQETSEKAGSARGVKSVKPPIKPKPIVPAKPRQAPASSPLLSPSAGGPCSPTSDIPSAVKISQLTGPQPYGTRRTSFRRWSSTAEEVVPDSNKLQSPAESSVPESPTKVVTQPLTASGKSLPTGSVWKGKSPFMLTTRGWGEQRKSQRKDDHESASANQKHSYILATQDSKKEVTVPLEENAVINLSSSEAEVAGHREVDVKNQLLSTSVGEDVKNTPFVPTRKARHVELPDQVKEIVNNQESSLETFIPSKGDVSHETVKHSSEPGHIQENKFKALSYIGDEETTPTTADSTSPEKVDNTFHLQIKHVTKEEPLQTTDKKLPENVSLQNKDFKEPPIIPSEVTAVPNANDLVTVSSGNIHTTEESPLPLLSEMKGQDVYRHNDHVNSEQLKSEILTKDEEDPAPGYLEASWTPEYTNKNKSEDKTPQKFKGVEEHVASPVSSLPNCSVVEHKIYNKAPNEEEEYTVPTTSTLSHTAEQDDFPGQKTEQIALATNNSNDPHAEDEQDKLVGLTGGHYPDHTLEAYEHYSGRDIHDYNENRQQETNATIQGGEYGAYPASANVEKQREHPAEKRLVDEKKVFSLDNALPSAPVLPMPPGTVPHLRMLSEIPDNLVSGEGNADLGDTSEKATHSYVEETIFTKHEETPSQSENYDPNRLGLSCSDSKSSSQDFMEKVTESAEISDHYKHTDRLPLYKLQSPEQTERQAQLESLETRETQHTHYELKEHSHIHAEEPHEKQGHTNVNANVNRYEQSGQPVQGYLQLGDFGDKYGESKEPSHVSSQTKESKPRYEQSEEPVNTNDQLTELGEKTQTYQSQEASVHKKEQVEELISTSDEQSKEPVNINESEGKTQIYQSQEASVHRKEQVEYLLSTSDEQSEEPVNINESEGKTQIYQSQEASVHTKEQVEYLLFTSDEQSEEPVNINESEGKTQIYQSPEASIYTKEQVEELLSTSDESFHKVKQSEEPVYEFKQSDQSNDKYDLSNESVQTYQPPGVSVSISECSQKYRQRDDQSDMPSHTFKQSDETSEKYEESGESSQADHKPGEAVHMYEHPEQNDHVILSEDPIYKLLQDVQSDTVNSGGPDELKEPSFIKAKSEEKSSDHTNQPDLMFLQQQNQQVLVVEAPDISVSSEKDHIVTENLKQQPSNSSIEVTKYEETASHEKLMSEIPLQDHRDQLSEDSHLLSNHEQETKHHITSKEAEHVDGPPAKPDESDELLPEKTQDQNDTIPFQNGHAEHEELQSDDAFDKEKPEEPQETQPEENFDFLEGTTVLDTSCMRSRASLGRKRCHRTPAAGTCASEEEADHEYWMFRDSTEPKSHPQEEQGSHDEEIDKRNISPDVTPDNSPSPGKSPKKGGIFGGIKSPSILKGRLKSRSKTTEGGACKQEAEESKSPTKENPESSSSLNWLHALKKKKKKQPK